MALSLGIGLGVTRRGGGAAAWTPASLPGFAVSLLPGLSRSQGKLWQDSGKTVPATADGDPVRVATCPYSGLDFTAPSDAARPLLHSEGSGKWSLAFDGADDRLAVVPTWATSAGSLAIDFRPTGNFATQPVIGTRTDATAGDLYAYLTEAYPRNFLAARRSAVAVVPVTAAWHHFAQRSGTTYRLYADGDVYSGATDWETPNVVLVGANNIALPMYLTGRVAGVIAATADWSDGDLALATADLAARHP